MNLDLKRVFFKSPMKRLMQLTSTVLQRIKIEESLHENLKVEVIGFVIKVDWNVELWIGFGEIVQEVALNIVQTVTVW